MIWRLASALLVALALTAPAHADTLLVARAAGRSLEFFDPGSGLRLAAVHLSCPPSRIVLSPDGKLAAIDCDAAADPGRPAISIVDLGHPAELRHVAATDPDAEATRPWLEARTSSDGRRAYVLDRATGHVRVLDARTGSVLRELDVGLRPDAIAVTDVMPRAVCHACQR